MLPLRLSMQVTAANTCAYVRLSMQVMAANSYASTLAKCATQFI